MHGAALICHCYISVQMGLMGFCTRSALDLFDNLISIGFCPAHSTARLFHHFLYAQQLLIAKSSTCRLVGRESTAQALAD